MPTAYLKKLAKLNNTSVDKLEKFWSQAKEIAKSEGQGNSWGLITSIFQNKLKKEGYNVKAFKEETRTSDFGQTFKFQRLSLSSIQKLLKYYLEDNEYNNDTHWNDLYDDNDGIVYVEYNDNKTFYSVTNPLLKDLKTTNIINCIIEYPSYTAYFGKDCRIEKFDSSEDSPYVVKSYKGNDNMKSYLYKGEVITASSKQEAIQHIVGAAIKIKKRPSIHIYKIKDDKYKNIINKKYKDTVYLNGLGDIVCLDKNVRKNVVQDLKELGITKHDYYLDTEYAKEEVNEKELTNFVESLGLSLVHISFGYTSIDIPKKFYNLFSGFDRRLVKITYNTNEKLGLYYDYFGKKPKWKAILADEILKNLNLFEKEFSKADENDYDINKGIKVINSIRKKLRSYSRT